MVTVQLQRQKVLSEANIESVGRYVFLVAYAEGREIVMIEKNLLLRKWGVEKKNLKKIMVNLGVMFGFWPSSSGRNFFEVSFNMTIPEKYR